MIAIPAIDLREGQCVQLIGGSYQQERVRLPNPLDVAEKWLAFGFSRLHVVDLDAATGRGSNQEVIEKLLTLKSKPIQVGGGVRDEEKIKALLASGASEVVVGTRAIEDPDWLTTLARKYPQRIIVAADVRDRIVVTHGWEKTAGRDVADVIDFLNPLPLAGILVTSVLKEGRMQGTDVKLITELAKQSQLPLCASGGIGTIEDLRELAQCGLYAVILGMALYTDALDPKQVAEEFT